jgi:hypothetical protein
VAAFLGDHQGTTLGHSANDYQSNKASQIEMGDHHGRPEAHPGSPGWPPVQAHRNRHTSESSDGHERVLGQGDLILDERNERAPVRGPLRPVEDRRAEGQGCWPSVIHGDSSIDADASDVRRAAQTDPSKTRGERQMERPIPGKAGAMRKFG